MADIGQGHNSAEAFPDFPKVDCRVCGNRDYSMSHHYEKMGVCARCARLIAVAYEVSHGSRIPDHLYEPGDEDLFPMAECKANRRKAGYIKQPISSKLRWAVFQRDDFTCLKCGSREDLTADHIDPERFGGKAVIENLQTLCRPCNSKKGAR